MINFKIKLLPGAVGPTKAHPSDAGWDLYAYEDVTLRPFQPQAISVGFHMALPEGYEAQIRPRSGLALTGLTVNNAPGTIDQNYRGEVKVILIVLKDHIHNLSGIHTTSHVVDYSPFLILKGTRIAQMVIKQVEPSQYEVVEELDRTDRGENGFGSSGFRQVIDAQSPTLAQDLLDSFTKVVEMIKK